MPSGPGVDFEEYFCSVCLIRRGVMGDRSNSCSILGGGMTCGTYSGSPAV